MSDIYEIDRIIDAKWVKDHWKYLVHWKGYQDSDDSWVVETDFDSSSLINNFWNLHDQTSYISKSEKESKANAERRVANEESYYDFDQAPFLVSNEKEILDIVKVFKKQNRISYLVKTKYSNALVLMPSEILMGIAPVKIINFLETLIKK